MTLIRRYSRQLAVTTLLLCVAAWAAAQQNALKLEWVLSGPPIGGMVPSGKAVLDQPSLPGRLQCEVKNVGLPDGTVLTVSMGGYNAGSLTLSRFGGKMQSLIPFQFRNGAFEIQLDGSPIMTGRFKN